MLGIFLQINYVYINFIKFDFYYNFIVTIFYFHFFTGHDKVKPTPKKENYVNKDDGTVFQMQRVDMLLAELLRKFPPPVPQNITGKNLLNQLF